MSKSKREYFLIALKGIAMGAADIVPGVSGGTIALIAGIYEEFIDALKSFSSVLGVLRKQGLVAAWKHVNGNFLIALFSGIAISLISLVQVIKFALVEHPILLWAFFFGLVLASCYYVGKRVDNWNWSSLLAIILGTIAIYMVTSIGPAETSTATWFIFVSGMLAICAMILPGISGAFILVLLGKYAYIIDALGSLDLKVIITFSLGAITGLLSFSHFLSFMLRKYHNFTIALLTGFMIGSLNKIWPWKNTLKWGVDRHGEKLAVIQENVLPNQLVTEDPQMFMAIFLGLIGFCLIVILEVLAAKKESI
ncbi:MAG: DUF368 domain-containing protein [Vicingaceae bacterium]